MRWDSVSGNYNLPAGLRLPHEVNVLNFSFSGASPENNSKTWYRYMLAGADQKWSEVTEQPFSEYYVNLKPGPYRFEVASKGFAGKWSAPATFSFEILPPWWATWWAYFIYGLLFITIVWVIVAYRSRALLKENKALEEKVEHRTLELKHSLEDLKSTQAQLIQSEKMASLGELTAGIAHEIQNPLNFVNNFSEVNQELLSEMKEEIDKGNLDQVKSIASDIIDNEQKIAHHGKRADAIVKGMLQHSRTSSSQKEPTDLNALVDEYLRLAYHGLRAKDKSFNASLETDLDDRVGNINIIPQEIGRVLLNLYTNSFYALSDKKKVQPEGFIPTIRVTTKRLPAAIRISVKDNGSGIPENVLDKIFNPFFTTKPTGEGTGLGLSLSYDIVKAHGGEIKVQTLENQGTEFVVELPDK